VNCIAFAAAAVLGLGLASASLAQTPPPPKPTSQQDQPSQTRPDARYPNPSGQDSKPNETPPPKSQADRARAKQPSSSPRTADPAEDNGAGKDVYTGSTGKKPNASTGCSTPTDAASAQGQTKQPPSNSKSRDTVCTTSGGDSTTHPKPQK